MERDFWSKSLIPQQLCHVLLFSPSLVSAPEWTGVLETFGDEARHRLPQLRERQRARFRRGGWRFPVQLFSRPPPSTTRPSLRVEIWPEFVRNVRNHPNSRPCFPPGETHGSPGSPPAHG